MQIEVRVLGCGTSTGVPLIGCPCQVCHSQDPRNRRLRSSIWLRVNDVHIQVDASPDFRQQMLTNGIRHIDALFVTHTHADHVHGIDDLRAYNFLQMKKIPVICSQETAQTMEKRFDYIFAPVTKAQSALPQLFLQSLEDTSFEINGVRFDVIPVRHGRDEVLGLRVGNFAYITDVSDIPLDQMARLQGLEVLIIGGLRYAPHPTHFTVDEALAVIKELQVPQSYLTHMSHDLEYLRLSRTLPAGVAPAYDGLNIRIDTN